MKFDSEDALKYANAALTAAKGGVDMNLNDSNAPYQYIFSVLSIAAGLVPGAGPLLGSLTGLLGAIVFPSKTDPDAVWNSLRAHVEALIDTKISDAWIAALRKKIEGLRLSMNAYTRTNVVFDKASDAEKSKAAEELRTAHTGFLFTLRANIGDFQVDQWAVPSLPLFTQVANMHLMLLSDGIKYGESWGRAKSHATDVLQPEFNELTASASRRVRGLRTRDNLYNLDELREAIKFGEAAGWAATLLDTWRAALETLSNAPNATGVYKRDKMSYPAHAKLYYDKGRGMVKPYKTKAYTGRGVKEALKFNALADYDTYMIKNVLSYAEFWPYLAGVKMPESAMQALDREIFAGPYGRYTDGASWSASSPPQVSPRRGNITTIQVRGFDDVDALRVRYGGELGPLFGDPYGGLEDTVNLAFDEYIKAVDVRYGAKLGQLTFFSNKDKSYGPFGHARHSQNKTMVQYDGFRLSSMYVTNWERSKPPGCEGIILGFRPQFFI